VPIIASIISGFFVFKTIVSIVKGYMYAHMYTYKKSHKSRGCDSQVFTKYDNINRNREECEHMDKTRVFNADFQVEAGNV
jgi:hypothetical protein